jgi:aryl-alcohol dehydrogenase-like predicted oxidoreductase
VNSISIGTANFGQSYGQTRAAKGLKSLEISKILEKLSTEKEIGLDTSPSYGDSEKVLGTFLKEYDFKGKITTKIPMEFYQDTKLMVTSLESSLKNLGVHSVDCTLLHGFNERVLENYKQITKGLEIILANGLTKEVGLSCYTEQDVEVSKNLIPQLSVFQVPENVIDQRLRNSTVLKKLSENGNRFYVRSIFLQGKLLTESKTLQGKLVGLKEVLESVEHSSESNGLSRLEFCWSYAKSLTWSSGIVVGVDSLNQLLAILDANEREYAAVIFKKPIVEQKLIDPRMW